MALVLKTYTVPVLAIHSARWPGAKNEYLQFIAQDGDGAKNEYRYLAFLAQDGAGAKNEYLQFLAQDSAGSICFTGNNILQFE